MEEGDNEGAWEGNVQGWGGKESWPPLGRCSPIARQCPSSPQSPPATREGPLACTHPLVVPPAAAQVSRPFHQPPFAFFSPRRTMATVPLPRHPPVPTGRSSCPLVGASGTVGTHVWKAIGIVKSDVVRGQAKVGSISMHCAHCVWYDNLCKCM